MMRPLFIAGNWKMNKLQGEARAFVESFLPLVQNVSRVVMVICPPFTCLAEMKQALAASPVLLGGQNLFWEPKGAYTGEVSADMLLDAGCRYVIIGHSERRQILGENNYMIHKKVQAALEAGLIPILCVGETLQERENNRAMDIVREQLSQGLTGLNFSPGELVVAYEPVWAIGTGVNASSHDAQEMIAFIRNSLLECCGQELAEQVPILYGGSVKEDNIAMFLAEPDIDGALIGGASLEADSLAAMIGLGEHVK